TWPRAAFTSPVSHRSPTAVLRKYSRRGSSGLTPRPVQEDTRDEGRPESIWRSLDGSREFDGRTPPARRREHRECQGRGSRADARDCSEAPTLTGGFADAARSRE